MMKTFTALLLTAVLLFAFGCANNNDTDNGAGEQLPVEPPSYEESAVIWFDRENPDHWCPDYWCDEIRGYTINIETIDFFEFVGWNGYRIDERLVNPNLMIEDIFLEKGITDIENYPYTIEIPPRLYLPLYEQAKLEESLTELKYSVRRGTPVIADKDQAALFAKRLLEQQPERFPADDLELTTVQHDSVQNIWILSYFPLDMRRAVNAIASGRSGSLPPGTYPRALAPGYSIIIDGNSGNEIFSRGG